MTRRLALALVAGWATVASAQHHGHPAAPPDPAGVPAAARFESTCRATVAGLVNRGVNQLHAFAFDQAVATFAQAIHGDLDCATGQWGTAMAQWGRFSQSGRPEALAEGWRALDSVALLRRPPSPRETRYLEALTLRFRERTRAGAERYAAAMTAIASDFPDDRHASLLAALALVERPAASAAEAEELGRDALAVLNRLPDGGLPALHYALLAGDRSGLAPAVEAQARAFAGTPAPSSYLQLLPGRIFLRLGHWEAARAAAQRAADSARAAGAAVDELRALDVLVHADLQLGNSEAAQAVVRRLGGGYLSGPSGAEAAALRAAIPARVALDRDAFAEAAAQPLPEGDGPAALPVLLARTIGAARLGRSDDAAAAAAQLRRVTAGLSPEAGAMADAAAAWAAFAAGRGDDAVAQLRAAAALEEAAAGPALPWRLPILPAREQLADLLRALGRRADATVEYDATLRRWPGRVRAKRGLAETRRADLEGPPVR